MRGNALITVELVRLRFPPVMRKRERLVVAGAVVDGLICAKRAQGPPRRHDAARQHQCSCHRETPMRPAPDRAAAADEMPRFPSACLEGGSSALAIRRRVQVFQPPPRAITTAPRRRPRLDGQLPDSILLKAALQDA